MEVDIVELYVIAGPGNWISRGRNIPGGYEYLSRNLRLLAAINSDVNFQVRVGHSVYHGQLSEFDTYPNMQVEVQEFDNKIIEGLSNLPPSIQHGSLLNELFRKHPPSCRFVLILDPDCYAVEINLISKCIQKIKHSNIAVVGVPYPASYPKEYDLRFPQVYFCLFDREVIRPEELDFRAGNNQFQIPIRVQSLQNKFSIKFLRGVRKILLGSKIVKLGSLVEILINMKVNMINRRHEINPLDTGWRLGVLIEREKIPFQIYPNILTNEMEICGFNCSEYLLANEDLSHLSGHLGWYFFRHGLTEARGLGIQGIVPKMLRRFIRSNLTDRAKWPVDSLLGRDRVSNLDYLKFFLEAFPRADYYAVVDKFCLFHLSTTGKGHVDDINILDKIIAEVISKTL